AGPPVPRTARAHLRPLAPRSSHIRALTRLRQQLVQGLLQRANRLPSCRLAKQARICDQLCAICLSQPPRLDLDLDRSVEDVLAGLNELDYRDRAAGSEVDTAWCAYR